MKWFKHFTDTWGDEKIAKLMALGGHAAYGIWWRLLEVIARNMEKGAAQCSVTYPVSRWSQELSVRGSHLRQWLSKLTAVGLLNIEWNGSDITISSPNLLKYRDEWQSRLPSKSQSQSQIQRQSQNIEVEAEADGLVPSSVNVKSRSSRSSGFVPELTDRPTDPCAHTEQKKEHAKERREVSVGDYAYVGQRVRIAKEEHEAYRVRFPRIRLEEEYPKIDARIIEKGEQRNRWAGSVFVERWLGKLAANDQPSTPVAQDVALKYGDGMRWERMSREQVVKYYALPASERGTPLGNPNAAAKAEESEVEMWTRKRAEYAHDGSMWAVKLCDAELAKLRAVATAKPKTQAKSKASKKPKVEASKQPNVGASQRRKGVRGVK